MCREQRDDLRILKSRGGGARRPECLKIFAGEIDAVGIVRLARSRNPAEIGDRKRHVFQISVDRLRENLPQNPVL